ncbi:hypothetical protein K435DRAFT_803434 [Dendrothele bispora CBS 962.96]|uniref:Uncharacterized protein n=1 Tax=Dendrothele bispora (strain CBS 962.96) TaxID=1314807 RepID=A0A4S8LI40_DENBC|nr:hypothetical protein K435DRAFT_803434 [Dendrothele bispora CBS 962.96]
MTIINAVKKSSRHVLGEAIIGMRIAELYHEAKNSDSRLNAAAAKTLGKIEAGRVVGLAQGINVCIVELKKPRGIHVAMVLEVLIGDSDKALGFGKLLESCVWGILVMVTIRILVSGSLDSSSINKEMALHLGRLCEILPLPSLKSASSVIALFQAHPLVGFP